MRGGSHGKSEGEALPERPLAPPLASSPRPGPIGVALPVPPGRSDGWEPDRPGTQLTGNSHRATLADAKASRSSVTDAGRLGLESRIMLIIRFKLFKSIIRNLNKLPKNSTSNVSKIWRSSCFFLLITMSAELGGYLLFFAHRTFSYSYRQGRLIFARCTAGY